jgi:hypothetical protein
MVLTKKALNYIKVVKWRQNIRKKIERKCNAKVFKGTVQRGGSGRN